jgi:peptidoglycan/xylan/chitin deacetylase (PgdA/CDA1 family)
VVVSVERFRFRGHASPFVPDGAPTLQYPDHWGHSQRDYGNRVGFFRLAAALERLGIRATAAVNSAICADCPAILEEIDRLGWEVIGHGQSASEPPHPGLDDDEERELIARSLAELRRASGQAVDGWLSPSFASSPRTLDVLAGEGVRYTCDWASDDLPFEIRAGAGSLVALPCSVELDDRVVLLDTGQSAGELADQLVEQADWLRREAAEHGARMMGAVLRPWISGVPHRSRHVERALGTILDGGGVWVATGGEIVTSWRAQAGGRG